MKSMQFYLIRAISNLHVGSGEGDFSVIDKRVQRDQVTNLPIIHASGIKGALREAMTFEARTGVDANGKDQFDAAKRKTVLTIFGSEPDPKKRDARQEKLQQGSYHFFDGKLLALPIRSSHDFFYIATCPALLDDAIAQLEQFEKGSPYLLPLTQLRAKANAKGVQYFGERQASTVQLEDWEAQHNNYGLTEELERLFGPRVALLPNTDFDQLAEELPIIARNYLNDGISKNLWYEEIVPREARFFTMISTTNGTGDLDSFLARQKKTVQLGANATVGYGLCAFKSLHDAT